MDNRLARMVIFLLAATGCLVTLHYAAGHFKPERQLILLNRTRPDFHNFPHGDLKAYTDYFKLVNEAMPDNSDGKLMLGYLDAISGKQAEAAVLFQDAYRMDDGFFFIDFNLALNFFRQGRYAEASRLLQTALEIPPQNTFKRMTRSIIYLQVFFSTQDSRTIIEGLQEAYHDAYLLLMESKAKERGDASADSGPHIDAHVI